MLKILEAPTLPIQALQRFSVVGCAALIYAGTHPILAIDNHRTYPRRAYHQSLCVDL
ncbi:hypothetical protein MiSe_04740 [Microseira wollei NIES-4236]|uniref:Uncharacterized protein n=1 Tax=Microseira wollei NIES-4236 TaxID=2530354 RepID=A0AAV3X5W9_9CYAN|nr:hypothetical protein MiSe_04740 [Microseira wollei NIES-4236]